MTASLLNKAEKSGTQANVVVKDSNFSFPRSARLLTAQDFDRVFSTRRARKGPNFCVHFRYPEKSDSTNGTAMSTPEQDAPALSRLGVVVPKKLVRLAVHRNQIKRMARETFRQLRPELPTIDLIVRVIVKIPPRNLRRDLPELKTQLLQLLKASVRQSEGTGVGTRPQASS